jgi:glycosyltransferase involved in cell wall biosynthesis
MMTTTRAPETIYRPLKVAIAHDYVTQRGGAERVVLALCRIFPDAPLYTTLYDPDGTFPEYKDVDIRVGHLNRFSYFRRNHRAAMPFLAPATSSLFIDADIVLVSSSGWAHGIRTNGKKIVFCHSPARWLYQPAVYLGDDASRSMKWLLAALSPPLRIWDRAMAKSADEYLAVSSAVRLRIEETYGVDARVLAPPHSIDTDQDLETVDGLWEGVPPDAYYLCVSRLLPYKNVDKIISAFRNTDRKLIVVGSGPEELTLRRTLPGNVRLLKDLNDAQMRWLYSHSKALVAASYEDFGLTPLEAGAYGKPSIVLRWGGFLDTVIENVTGVYFDEPEAGEIAEALGRFEARPWNRHTIAEHAREFDEERFAQKIREVVIAQAVPVG